MRIRCIAFTFWTLLFVLPASAALFNNGSVNVVTTNIGSGIAIVDGGTPIGPTTVNLQSGAIGRLPLGPPPVSVLARDRSVFNMSGGTTDAAVVMLDASMGSMSGGTIETDLVLFDDAFFQLNAGTIDLAIFTFDDTRIDISGGDIGGSNTNDPSLLAGDSSEVNISDGTFQDDVVALQQAIITMTGGNVMDDLEAEGMSQVFLRGGDIGDDVHSYDNAQVTITGGTIDEDVEAEDNSMIFIRGGVFGVDNSLDSGFGAYDNAMITVFGSNFAVGGTSVGPGGISDLTGTLTGTLANGDALDIPFEQTTAGQIKLVTVPEPSSVLLWGFMGGVGIWGVRRRRKA